MNHAGSASPVVIRVAIGFDAAGVGSVATVAGALIVEAAGAAAQWALGGA